MDKLIQLLVSLFFKKKDENKVENKDSSTLKENLPEEKEE